MSLDALKCVCVQPAAFTSTVSLSTTQPHAISA